jgi:hypothetical protein
MAYINGNKPIVTNGLVYALDFGNTKSYVSGSNRAVSLAYNPPTTVVTGSTASLPVNPGVPAYSLGILSFTGSQFIQRTSSFSFLTQNNSFTLSYVALSRTEGTIVSQRTSDAVFNIQIAPTQSQIGFYYDNQSHSRLYTFPSSSNLRYFTYRFDSGSFDFFINGVPVTSSNPNAPIQNYEDLNTLYIGMQTGETRGMSGSLANFYVYNRALTADEIYSNYSVFAGRFGMPMVPKPYSIDEDLYQYIQTSGIADSNTQTALSTFISGLKSNGLWNKFIAIYPFLGSTTSSQALNLKEPGPYSVSYTGSWTAGSSGSTGTPTSTISLGVAPTTLYSDFRSSSAHLTYLSYDLPQTSSYLVGAVSYMSASGGDIIFSGSRTYHVFTASATFSAFQQGAVEILAIGGGGSAQGLQSGGGGAGGVVYQTTFTLPSGSSIVTVGTGGLGVSGSYDGTFNPGQNTTIGTITAFGGGAGRQGATSSGGSSGGSGVSYNVYGNAVLGQGNRGGIPINISDGSGGGGAGQPGKSALVLNGAGGSGSYYPQFAFLNYGSPAGWFAGGGGGGAGGGVGGTNTAGGKGGIGGGGDGGYSFFSNGGTGSANTGGGGGGVWFTISGAGGSGIVIISYPTTPTSSFALKITETSLTGSLNSPETSAITASGNIGLVTVSRKQAGILSLHKNTVSASFGTSGDFLPFPNLYLNAANNAGTASGITPSTIAFASVGAGLTTTEVATYHNLIGQLQANLKRQNTLLDNYSGAAAAYSLRRIGPSNYFGPAIRVRRDSDNTLRDIGFTSDGQLDTVGLLDFVGVTGSGFVNTWYDQSGNGRDATQATSANQPRVILSGSIDLLNKKPAISYKAGRNDNLSFTSIPFVRSVFWVTNPFTTGVSDSTSFLLGDQTDYSFAGFNNQYFHGSYGNGNLFKNGQSISIVANRTNSQELISFHNITTTTATSGAPRAGQITRDRSINGRSLENPIQELIIYTTDQSSTRTSIETAQNNNYKIYGSATASFDPDYSAFISATGITQPTQSAALETLVSDLKSYGLWNKMKAIYPMITDKNNRFAYSQELNTEWNPVNTVVATNNVTAPDGTLTAERLTETTSSITTYTVTNNGASAYTINGSDNPTLTLERGKTYQFNISATGHPFFIMTGSGAYTAGGQYDVGVTGQGTQSGTLTFVVPDAAPSTLAYVCQVHSSMGGTINVINNTDTHYIYQTIADGLVTGSEYVASIYGRFLNRPWIAMETNTGAKAWFNIQTGITGSLTGSNATITAVSGGWYRCALYFTSSVASGPQNIQYNLADANGNLSYAGVAGTGSYLWGAQFENGNVLGPYRATTATGFTTGSMLDQMKYNLKNTGSFSGSYFGGLNPGYSGNKPNGVSGYIDTGLNVNTVLTLNSTHLAYYSRTNVPGGSIAVEMGVTGTHSTYLLYNYLGIGYSGINGGQSGRPSAASPTTGFLVGSRISSTEEKYYTNNISQTFTNTSTGKENKNIFLMAFNNVGAQSYSTKECAFATIGDGLTDYEAKALYWIVQKYQTTLGRQVY